MLDTVVLADWPLKHGELDMYGYFFDSQYLLLVLIPGLIMSGLASLMVKSSFARYSRQRTQRGITGAQAAQLLLQNAGIYDVRIERAHGLLSDHYNPVTRTLALSESVHDSTSVAAMGVACHEAGHAIQHADHYGPLWLRSSLVPIVSFGSHASEMLLLLGFVLHARPLLIAGVLAFATIVLFQLITLPVEFDASARAKRLCREYGIVTEAEAVGVGRVLNAAALTYVAAFVTSLLTLLYYLIRLGLLNNNRNDD
jgi:Zn-dependent membrane protease YugP